MTGMGDYSGDCDDEAKLIRFVKEAEQGIHTCENCLHNETDYEGQLCNAENSDFPAIVEHVSADGREKSLKCGIIPYDKECRPRDCPKWELRTKSEREINRERTRKFFQICADDKKKHCLCNHCKCKTCMEKDSFEFPSREETEPKVLNCRECLTPITETDAIINGGLCEECRKCRFDIVTDICLNNAKLVKKLREISDLARNSLDEESDYSEALDKIIEMCKW